MNLEKKTQEEIAIEVIRVLVHRFKLFPNSKQSIRNAPFHEAFLAAFADKIGQSNISVARLIGLSSWMHGLNTTLGQTFFENVAHILSDGEKKEWTSKKLGNLKISSAQKSMISDLITDLSNSNKLPNRREEDDMILAAEGGALVEATNFSADVFYETDTEVVAIELKTVQPNSGEFKGEKQKILEGKAALRKAYPGKDVYFYIGFPFDRTVDTEDEDPCSSNKQRFMEANINCTKYFAEAEVLLADELWDFLSGKENTMQDILTIINSIAKPDFELKFEKLLQIKEQDKREMLELLEEWYLYSEMNLLKNAARLRDLAVGNGSLLRVLNTNGFNVKGQYNWKRYTTLMSLFRE